MKTTGTRAVTLAAALLAFGPCLPVAAGDAASLSEASLVAERRTVHAGQPFNIALRLRPAPGWHTYWRNPGDSGMATTIDWQLPPGFASGPIQWPLPERISSGPLTSYGYGGEVLLITEITPPPTLAPQQTIPVAAKADWLVCREICVPQSAELKLTLTVADGTAGPAAPDPVSAKAFAYARASMPTASRWPATYRAHGGRMRLTIDAGDSLKGEYRSVAFYPYDGLAISNSSPQRARLEDGVITIDVDAADGGAPAPDPLTGILVVELAARRHGIEITAHRDQSS